MSAGEVALARSTLADAPAAACQRARDRDGLTYALDGLAAVASRNASPGSPPKGIGAADTTRERIGIGLYPLICQTLRAPFASAVQAALGTAEFQTARTDGGETGWPARSSADFRSHAERPVMPSDCAFFLLSGGYGGVLLGIIRGLVGTREARLWRGIGRV